MAQHEAQQGQRHGHRRRVPTQREGKRRDHGAAREDELREVHRERIDDGAPEGPGAPEEEPAEKEVAVEAMREGPRADATSVRLSSNYIL